MADLVTYASDEAMTLVVTGGAPNGFMAHRFGDGSDMRTLMDPTSYADLKLKCTQGGAGGAGAVVLQQVRQ